MSSLFLDSVKRVLKDSYRIKTNTLIENNKGSGGKHFKMERSVVSFKGVEYLIYRFDPDAESLFPYFKEIKDLSKICDFIIFAQRADEFFVFLIEMKLSSGSPEKQLEMSEGFVKFILTRVETLCDKIDDDKFFIRKIGLKDTACPQKMGTLGYPSLRYNKSGYMLLHKDFDVNLPLLMDALVD